MTVFLIVAFVLFITAVGTYRREQEHLDASMDDADDREHSHEDHR